MQRQLRSLPMVRQPSSELQPGAMRSTIAWALLGLVIERPSYGWELVQRFRRIYGETLALSSPARIYVALESLSARAMIEEVKTAESTAPEARQPKPHYRATQHGMRAYEEWLLIQMEEERQRQRLFARQLAMLEPEAALEVIDRYEQECLAESDEVPPSESEREMVADRLADQDEQLGLEARLTWIRYARGELTALLEERTEAGEDQ